MCVTATRNRDGTFQVYPNGELIAKQLSQGMFPQDSIVSQSQLHWQVFF